MPNSKVSPSYPEKPLPAVHAAAHDFHLVVLQWLEEARAPRALVAPLGRASRRATLALYVAGHSPSYRRHLRRAKEDMLFCLALFSTLIDEGHFSEELGREALRHINQILMGIDQLAETPVDEWLELVLPPLAPATATNADVASRHSRRALEEKIRFAANLGRFFPVVRAERKPRKRSAAPLGDAPTNGASG